MNAVIVGCGRVGAEAAGLLERAGYDVIVLDIATRAFDRLPESFRGSAVRGDGTDEDTLRRSGAEGADVFLALTEGDNRNIMAAQLASDVLGARRVIAKINDPVRARAYADLGLATLCRTTMMSDAISGHLGLPLSGEPGIRVPAGRHPGGDHHDLSAGGPTEGDAAAGPGAASGRMAVAGGSASTPAPGKEV